MPKPKMKRFAGIKTLEQIEAQCESQGLHFNNLRHKIGGDHIVITSIEGNNDSGQVLYNTFNGNFFGTTPEGVQFDSKLTEHEKEPWFQALLSFFYVEAAPK